MANGCLTRLTPCSARSTPRVAPPRARALAGLQAKLLAAPDDILAALARVGARGVAAPAMAAKAAACACLAVSRPGNGG